MCKCCEVKDRNRSLNEFDISKKKIFLRSWHWIGDDTLLKEKNTIIPYNILPEFLDEPILVSCSEDDKLSCFSNDD